VEGEFDSVNVSPRERRTGDVTDDTARRSLPGHSPVDVLPSVTHVVTIGKHLR
jgi:hypothetical protein